MWKPLVAVFVVAALGTVALTNLDRFFPTDDMSRPTCDAAAHVSEPSCCSAMATPSCCEFSAEETASIAQVSATEKDAQGLLAGGMFAAK